MRWLPFVRIQRAIYQRNHLECLAVQHAPSAPLAVLSESKRDMHLDGQHSRVEQPGDD